jgi:hypothetical protein
MGLSQKSWSEEAIASLRRRSKETGEIGTKPSASRRAIWRRTSLASEHGASDHDFVRCRDAFI